MAGNLALDSGSCQRLPYGRTPPILKEYPDMRARTILANVLLAAASLLAQPAAGAGAPDTLSAAAVREDLQTLYLRLQESHYDLFARRSRDEYDALHAALVSAVEQPMAREDVLRLFQRFTAFGRVAHASVEAAGVAFEAYREGGGVAFPFRVRVREGRAFVVQSSTASDDIDAGDEMLSIEGRSVRALLLAMGEVVSADNEHLLHTLVETRFASLLWEVLGPRPSFGITLRKVDGRQLSIRVPATSRAQAQSQIQPAGQLDLDWHRREARILPGRIGYLRPGPFYNVDGGDNPWDTTAFSAFIDRAFTDFVGADAQAVLIDLRSNPGGDNSFSDLMLAWFATEPFRFASRFSIRVSEAATASNALRLRDSEPGSMSHQLAAAYAGKSPGEKVELELPLAQPRSGARFKGRVAMLINRHSWSNTANVAALAQDYGFATLLGEETADLATTYGAVEHFSLPHSGIRVGFPKAYIVRVSGSEAPQGVRPDVVIETPLTEPASDPVLQEALDWLRR
jgi:hypothetical protein